MIQPVAAIVGPVGESDRIRELDVLRGVALFGVLLMNFVAFAGAHILATEAQLAALPTAALDERASFAVRWLVGDKANTMFATLFGLGFYLQMKRGEGRPGFEARYRRRLFWLLIFGWLNAVLLWIWDILNLYALAGFALLAMRNWRTRSLVLFGLVAALYSEKLQEWWTGALGLQLMPESIYSDAAVLGRQTVAVGGDYPAIVAMMWSWTWTEWLAGGLMAAWLVYALGRFALGAAIGRSGILDDVRKHLPLLRRIAWIALPAGLVIGFLLQLVVLDIVVFDQDWPKSLAQSLRSPAALILATGYSAAIVVALHTRAGAKLFAPLAPVGRMALTNYLAQGLIYAFVMFGVGPGLGLAGRIGTSAVILICIAFFAAQVAISHWWLARYRFGPMEWLWRALTYGERPPFRRFGSAEPAVV
ncbi:MAG TPA: DUF418 domain-containing protein [Sphingomicrobium sp.]|nr:DUF418 domain-containing protein [Sphingomicrobium sp.]